MKSMNERNNKFGDIVCPNCGEKMKLNMREITVKITNDAYVLVIPVANCRCQEIALLRMDFDGKRILIEGD